MRSVVTESSVNNRIARTWLGLVVTAWGIQAIVSQSLLIREALVLMFGSELAWGIILFAWLLGVSVGGAIGGWSASKLKNPDIALAVVVIILSILICAELWLFRGARAWLGVQTGELLPINKTALAAMIFVSPVGLFIGLAFPLACKIAHNYRQTQTTGTGVLGNIYAYESAGSLIGGAAFSFWAVEHLSPIQTALTCAVITMAASALLLTTTRPKYTAGFIIAALAGATLAVTIYHGQKLNDQLVKKRWQTLAPGCELYQEIESKYQNLAVGRRAEQFTLFCDGQVTADFPDPYSFVKQAHLWMCQHPDPKKVLVLGGGSEGLLAEILKHPVKKLDYIEPDHKLIQLIKPYLTDADRQALNDPRVNVHYLDARYFIKTRHNQYDLVVARLPEPTSAMNARLYTDEFFRELRRAMTDRAVLCTTAAATPTSLTAASAEYLGSIRDTIKRHFPITIVGWDDPAQILAATDTNLISIDPKILTGRYNQRNVKSEYFNPLWFEQGTDWLDPEKINQRASELDAAENTVVSTDLQPFIYIQKLTLWERMTGRENQYYISKLRSIGLDKLCLLIAAAVIITLAACRIKNRTKTGWATGSVITSVATSGFTTMALSIIWLFAFQNLYGYVYQRIGWIVALFMAGLIIGCALTSRMTERICRPEKLSAYLWHRLIFVDVLMAALALSIPFVLPALSAMQTAQLNLTLVEWAVSVMVTATGILGGASFALAGALQLKTTGQTATAAGSIVAADHAGACIGALLTGILLVPVFGTPTTAYLLVAIKIASAIILAAGQKLSKI